MINNDGFGFCYSGILIPCAVQYGIRCIRHCTGQRRCRRGEEQMKRSKKEIILNHRYLIIAAIVLAAIIIAGVAAILTLTILPDQPGMKGVSLPYSTTFHVSLPEGEKVSIGNLDILTLRTGDRIALKIGESREEMVMGEEREISDRNATIMIFGQPFFETGYRLMATWTGMKNDRALFIITLKTSRQVPDWLISRVIPADIQASPA
jgi:hypothetical protein